MKTSLSDLAGTYRLIVNLELIRYIEQTLVALTPDSEREKARAEALNEARGAELEISADGELISSSHGQEFLRARLSPNPEDPTEFLFQKPNGEQVQLRWLAPNTVQTTQSGKPTMRFLQHKVTLTD